LERATGCSHAQIRACQTSNRGCRPSFGHWHQHQCHAGMVATLIFCCQQAEQTYALVHQKRFFHCHAGGRLFWAALQKQHLVLVDSAALGTWTPKPPSPISAEVERRSSCGDRLGPPRRGVPSIGHDLALRTVGSRAPAVWRDVRGRLASCWQPSLRGTCSSVGRQACTTAIDCGAASSLLTQTGRPI